MKRTTHLILIGLMALALGSCAVLQPVTLHKAGTLKDYKHVYIVPTAEVRDTYLKDNGDHHRVVVEDANPYDIIGARLLLKGFIPVQEITAENVAQTLVVEFSATQGSKWFMDETQIVTITFKSARTGEVVASGTCEHYGSTKSSVSDLKNAIHRCLTHIFRNDKR